MNRKEKPIIFSGPMVRAILEGKTFLSIEPILAPFDRRNVSPQYMPSWAVVGAETGNGKGKIIPQKSWIDEISAAYKENGKPVFMKDSLRELMGADFVQEYPWEMKGKSR